MEDKTKWGSPQEYGELKIKYKPTGEIRKLKLGIKRMSYHNELIFCESWGYDKGNPTDLNNPDNYELIDIIPKDKSDKECLTVGEVRELFADMYNNLPADDSELIKTAKGMVKEIDNRQDYVSRRLRELSLILANYEDDLDNYPSDECEERKETLKLAVEIGRAKIDELKKLEKELSILSQKNKKEVRHSSH
jgi:hypothetical protein